MHVVSCLTLSRRQGLLTQAQLFGLVPETESNHTMKLQSSFYWNEVLVRNSPSVYHSYHSNGNLRFILCNPTPTCTRLQYSSYKDSGLCHRLKTHFIAWGLDLASFLGLLRFLLLFGLHSVARLQEHQKHARPGLIHHANYVR